MKRRSILLLVVLVLVAALAIAAIWTQVVPKYRARAEVRVRPIIPYLVFQTEDSGMIPLYDSFVNTQVSVMRSLTVLQRVLDQTEIQETQWYKKPRKSLLQRLRGKPATPPIERLRDALSVQPRPQTEIIDVTFMDPTDKDAKIIVDAVLDQYIKYIEEKADETKDELYRKLVDEYKSLENEIKGRGKITAQLRRSLGTDTPQELISGMRARLDGTRARLSELRQSIALLEWERKQVITHDSNDVPVASTVRMKKKPRYYEDADWRALDRNVRTIQHNIAASELDPNDPEIIRATKDMKFAKELLRLREVQLDEQWRNQLKNTARVPIATIVASGLSYEEASIYVEHQLARAKQEQKLLLAEFEKQQAEFEELFETVQLLEKENNALLHKRELFGAVRQRLDQKNMERNVPGSIEVLTRAFVPSEPHKDRRIVFTAIALVLGSIGITFTGWLLKRRKML